MTKIHFKDLPDNMANYMVPTMFESRLVGVQNISQDNTGKMIVLYNDKTELSCISEKNLFDFSHIFEALDHIQDNIKP